MPFSFFQIPLCPQILRTSDTHADDLKHPHCIPNSLYFSSQMTHSFILFDLSLFLKIQYPTHAHTRISPYSIVSLACASGNPPTRTRALRSAQLTPEAFHHLGTLGPKGLKSPSSPHPNPQQLPPPPCPPSSPLSCTSVPPFSPTNPSTQYPQPHLPGGPAVAASPQFRALRPGRSRV